LSRKKDLGSLLGGVLVALALVWIFVIQPILNWITAHKIISTIIGILFIISIIYGVKYWIDARV